MAWSPLPLSGTGRTSRQQSDTGAVSFAIFFAEGSLAGVRYLDPFRVGRGVGHVAVVPVPPFVRPALRITLRRVFPLLLTSERGDVEVAPDRAHRLVAAAVDEVSAEDALPVADEGVVAVPFVDAEVGDRKSTR